MISDDVSLATGKKPAARPLVGPLLGRWREPDHAAIHELAAVYPDVAAKIIDVFEALDVAGMPSVPFEDDGATFPMMQAVTGIDVLEGQGARCRALVEKLMTNRLPPASA